MRKKIDFGFLIKVVAYTKYLPVIIFKIKNWPDFVLNYVGIKDKQKVYEFRNGLKIKTIDGLGAVTIAVIFIKNDYGQVKDDSVIIDIGANIGAYSLFASQAKNAKVYAFEPMPDNYNLFTENIRLNGLEEKIFAFNLAVGAKKETRSLYLGGSPFHSLYPIKGFPSNGLMNISCVSLKNIFDENKIEKCDILKMDCEGAEFEILYNLPEEYFEKIKEIRLEYHDHAIGKKNNSKYLQKFLEQKGFKVTRAKKVNDSNGDLWLEKSMNIEEYSKYKQFYDENIPNLLLKYLNKNNWNSYLDLGCGDGSLLNVLNKKRYFKNKTVYAVDLSENRINLVKKINKDFICLVGDACDVEAVEENSIDFLVSSQVIEHVESDEKMIKEIYRLLKKDGVVYLSTVFKKWYGWYFYKCNGKWTLDPTHLREYSSDDQLLDIFKKYGFEIEESEKTIVKYPLVNFVLKRIGAGSDEYNNLFVNTLRKFKIPILGYYEWKIVCKKK